MVDREAYLSIIRGERRGPLAALARAGLGVASLGFRAGVALRNSAYGAGLAAAHRPALPVISIGNLTVGGTGKTPLAILLSRRLIERGEKVAVLARGYGAARDGEPNDELLLVKERVPGALIFPGRDRVASADKAAAAGATVLLLDDGFQHRRLARDLDLVLVDATDPWGGEALLPRGLLREPLSALARAGEVVVTRVEQAEDALPAIKERLAREGVTAPVTPLRFEPMEVRHLGGAASEPASSLRGQRVSLLSAIGRPAAFRRTVELLGATVIAEHAFPDHHAYSRHQVESAIREAAGLGAIVVTTEKDAVKLVPLSPRGTVRVLSIEARLDDERALLARVEAAIASARAARNETTNDRDAPRATPASFSAGRHDPTEAAAP